MVTIVYFYLSEDHNMNRVLDNLQKQCLSNSNTLSSVSSYSASCLYETVHPDNQVKNFKGLIPTFKTYV